tara:strand:- start:633 stop:878 length:246 start_codon:yes stop_codon:yes gene_type:complete
MEPDNFPLVKSIQIENWQASEIFPQVKIGGYDQMEKAVGLCSVQQLHDPSWTGGHFTLPYEQYTQQSPSFGFRTVLQFSHS